MSPMLPGIIPLVFSPILYVEGRSQARDVPEGQEPLIGIGKVLGLWLYEPKKLGDDSAVGKKVVAAWLYSKKWNWNFVQEA